jgi:soluble lytic murein transglycosylase-like protein
MIPHKPQGRGYMVRATTLALLFALLTSCGTDKRTSAPKKEKEAGLLFSEKHIIGSGILVSARNDSFFDAEKWLKSDRLFFKRARPNRISEYDRIIKKMARRYGFDWRLIAAQIYVESRFRNAAQSHAGAQGLMQIVPSTAEFMGFDKSALLKPEINIAVGYMYDQRMYSLWGKQTENKENRLAFALASYNAGRGRVLKSYSTKEGRNTWVKVYPFLPQETQMYVHKIYLKYDLFTKHVMP